MSERFMLRFGAIVGMLFFWIFIPILFVVERDMKNIWKPYWQTIQIIWIANSYSQVDTLVFNISYEFDAMPLNFWTRQTWHEKFAVAALLVFNGLIWFKVLV